MAERIMISFEMNKDDLLNMFQEEYISKALDEFLKEYFSSYIEIHANTIRHNMKAIKQEIEEEKIQQIVLNHLKSYIEIQDMKELQVEAAKAFFKESFTKRTEPNIAIHKAFKSMEVIAIAGTIQKKLRNQYLLASV